MIRKNKIVEPTSFPDHLASDEEKAKDEFGLQMAKAIEYEWFYRPETGGTSCAYADKRDKYHKLRLYGRGEQDTKKYKDLLNGGDDESYTNFDWRPLQIIPKFVKLIVNQMTERLFDVKAEATDNYSTNLKTKEKEYLENLMISKPLMEKAREELGVEMQPDGYDEYPQTQEEIDLHMNLNYKPAIEIASEEAIKYTLDLNDYDEIQSRVIEDITTIGLGAIKHTTDPNKGIIIEYVDPSDLVYSYPRNRNFKDVHYYGEVRKITINELKRLAPEKFTDDELRAIAQSTNDWARYHGNTNDQYAYREDDLGGAIVDVLNFNFKSTNTITYKKKYMGNGGFKMIKKSSDFDKVNNQHDGYDVAKKVIEVWYEGMLILGTNKLVKYNLCENMVRPKGYLNRTVPNYIMYAPEIYQNRTKSLVERIIPYVDQMQQIHIKLQQLIAKTRPNGIYIDVDGLNEIDLGDGNFLTPLEAVKIYNQTGNVIGTSITAEGDYNYGREPIRELKNGVVSGLPDLMNSYNHYLNLLRDAIGVPQGADASAPHPDMAVGVQQQIALNSNTATKHILDSMLNMTERLGEGLSLRLKDIFKYSDLKNTYLNTIGKVNMKILESLKNYHLHDIGILIELKPDAQEKQYLENNIQQGIAQQIITLDDAIDIRSINNIKLANQVIKIRRLRREKERKNHEKEIAQITQTSQIQAAQEAAKAKQMEIQTKAQSELQLIQAKTNSELIKINAEKKAKSELMQQEFEYNMTIKGIETESAIMNEKFKEDRKDKRQDRQNTQASQMIEQRGNNTASLNFESSEDNISGGIDMGELEPS